MANRPSPLLLLLPPPPPLRRSRRLSRPLLESLADYSTLRWLASSRINATSAGDKQQIFNCARVCTRGRLFLAHGERTDGWMRDRAKPARLDRSASFFAMRVITGRSSGSEEQAHPHIQAYRMWHSPVSPSPLRERLSQKLIRNRRVSLKNRIIERTFRELRRNSK